MWKKCFLKVQTTKLPLASSTNTQLNEGWNTDDMIKIYFMSTLHSSVYKVSTYAMNRCRGVSTYKNPCKGASCLRHYQLRYFLPFLKFLLCYQTHHSSCALIPFSASLWLRTQVNLSIIFLVDWPVNGSQQFHKWICLIKIPNVKKLLTELCRSGRLTWHSCVTLKLVRAE